MNVNDLWRLRSCMPVFVRQFLLPLNFSFSSKKNK